MQIRPIVAARGKSGEIRPIVATEWEVADIALTIRKPCCFSPPNVGCHLRHIGRYHEGQQCTYTADSVGVLAYALLTPDAVNQPY